ncbi:MAG: P27 family phage terminase small subunit [Solirubrobacteraceae bacterium]
MKAAGRRFFNDIAAEWEQRSDELSLLIAACEQLDISESCRKTIAAEGLTITTAKGAVKENPALATSRQAVRLFAALCKQMHFEDETPDAAYKGRVRPHRHRRS